MARGHSLALIDIYRKKWFFAVFFTTNIFFWAKISVFRVRDTLRARVELGAVFRLRCPTATRSSAQKNHKCKNKIATVFGHNFEVFILGTPLPITVAYLQLPVTFNQNNFFYTFDSVLVDIV